MLSNFKFINLLSLLIAPVKSAAPIFFIFNRSLSNKILPLIKLNSDSKEFIKELFEKTLFVDKYNVPFNFLLILRIFFIFRKIRNLFILIKLVRFFLIFKQLKKIIYLKK